MDERISEELDMVKIEMEGALEFLENQLTKIRTGKASPEMLFDVLVDYYGSPTPLNQVGTISAADARMLTVTPWEKRLIPAIDKAIRDSGLGLNPTSDSDMVRVPIPSLNEERRKSLVKQAKDEAETARISLRSMRHKVMDSLKKLQKAGVSEDEVKVAEQEVDKITKDFTAKVEDHIKEKEKQIMTV